MSLHQRGEDRQAVMVVQLLEDLRQIRRMLLLQQVQQVVGRTNPEQALDRVEHDFVPAEGRHGTSVVVARLLVRLDLRRANRSA
jgi:hypothetical protein